MFQLNNDQPILAFSLFQDREGLDLLEKRKKKQNVFIPVVIIKTE